MPGDFNVTAVMQLVPTPKKLRIGKTSLALAGKKYLKINHPLTPRFLDAVRRLTGPLGLTFTFGNPQDDQCLGVIDCRRGPRSEDSYELNVATSGIELLAHTESGLFRGLMTLSQLLENADDKLATCQISDEPDFAHRGVMLDISRCKVPTLDTLFTLIDQLAALKFNQLQLYTEHTFAFSNHPVVWANASPFDATDIQQIRDYCEARYIELVPNLNSFGHFERWLRHPPYHKYAECPAGFTHPLSGESVPFGSTLLPARKSLSLLASLYDEYLPLFTSEHFNIGGDEPWELGHGRSAKRCEATSSTDVYLDFMADIQKLVEKRGRRMQFWSDIVLKDSASLKRLSRNATLMIWGYEANHPFKRECELIAQQRIPFYVCPGTSSWNSLVGRRSNMTGNILAAGRHGLNTGATGLLVTDWGDHGHHQYLPVSYPGFIQAAATAWNVRKSKDLDLVAALKNIFGVDRGQAQVLVDMGDVADIARTPLRNATIFNRCLFSDMNHEPTATRDIKDPTIKKSLNRLMDLKSKVINDPSLVGAELCNALAMASHGLKRLQYRRGNSEASLEALETEASLIIQAHDELWLARNRPGGLDESRAHLERSRGALRLMNSADVQ